MESCWTSTIAPLFVALLDALDVLHANDFSASAEIVLKTPWRLNGTSELQIMPLSLRGQSRQVLPGPRSPFAFYTAKSDRLQIPWWDVPTALQALPIDLAEPYESANNVAQTMMSWFHHQHDAIHIKTVLPTALPAQVAQQPPVPYPIKYGTLRMNDKDTWLELGIHCDEVYSIPGLKSEVLTLLNERMVAARLDDLIWFVPNVEGFTGNTSRLFKVYDFLQRQCE